MCSILYINSLEKSPYASILSPTNWLEVENAFIRDCCSLMGLPHDDPLELW